MEVITRVFDTQDNATQAIQRVRQLGISERRVALLTPNDAPERIEKAVPVSDTEDPGMGKAMGAAVGAGMGAAGGATLGLAAASLIVPGVGPVLAFGLIGAALLGGTGAAVGATVGNSIEEELGEGFTHEDVYLYEDALRQGKSIVVVYADEGRQADQVRDLMDEGGSLNLDSMREEWWQRLRDRERDTYQSTGRDFQEDELSYRQGFQAAQHPVRRGKSYPEAEANLREAYGDHELNTAFRDGYERGAKHQSELARGNNG